MAAAEAIIKVAEARMAVDTTRGQLREDPVIFAIKDRVSLALGIVVLGLLALAVWSGR